MAEKKKGRDIESEQDIKPEKEKTKLHELKELAAARDVPAWELAGMMRAASWADGRLVSAEQFDFVLTKFRKRPQGGGKISK